jgi:hypothetical protein
MAALEIITSYEPKPIPSRNFDWSAITSDYQGDPGEPCGWGSTAEAARLDLVDQIEGAAE